MYASHMGISGVSTNERFAWNNKDVRAMAKREAKEDEPVSSRVGTHL